MSPIYPSPMADFGYDVSDYEDVDPVFGTLADFDALCGLGRTTTGCGCSWTWCRATPRSSTPGFASTPTGTCGPTDGPEQLARRVRRLRVEPRPGRPLLPALLLSASSPTSNWRNPEVVAAMQGVVRFWLERGVDGFRLDAIDRADEGPADCATTRRPPSPSALPCSRDYRPTRARALEERAGHRHALSPRSARRPATRCWWARCTCPPRGWGPYLEHLDRAFAFELLHSPWEARGACARRSPPARRSSRQRGLGACRTTTSRRAHHALRARERARRGACCC